MNVMKEVGSDVLVELSVDDCSTFISTLRQLKQKALVLAVVSTTGRRTT